jgi:nonsense-mediated mRNA decay protein 3
MDASWVWTEPHSKRLKVKLVVQREVMHGAVLQQVGSAASHFSLSQICTLATFTQAKVVTFTIRNRQAPEVAEKYRTGMWMSCVQVRQRVAHPRTFLQVHNQNR